MADNVTLNTLTGSPVIATDDDGTAQHQYVKVEFGADNTQTKVAAASGQGLPVQGEAAENAAATGNPVQIGGRYDSTPRTLGNGDVGAIALDADGAVHIADGGNTITVDGTVAATQSGGWTVDLGATDNTVLDNIDTNTDYGQVVGGGVEATALRVTIASDSTGVVSVDDNGGSLTVDGTVAATQSGSWTIDLGATDNAVLDSIVTNTTGLAGCVGGTELQVDIVGSIPAGTNAIGKLSANSGVDIGDVDVTSISAGTNLIGDVGISGARTSGGTSIFRSLDLDETEEEIKATAGQIYWIHAMNLTAATLFLKIYNATAASVTVGTTTPVLTFPIPTQGDTNGAGFVFSITNGVAFSTAITVAVTTGVADSDTTGPAANGCVVNIGYA